MSYFFFALSLTLFLKHDIIVINKFNCGGKRCECKERRNYGEYLPNADSGKCGRGVKGR